MTTKRRDVLKGLGVTMAAAPFVAAAPAIAQAKPLRIGIIAPRSGAAGTIGECGLRAVEWQTVAREKREHAREILRLCAPDGRRHGITRCSQASVARTVDGSRSGQFALRGSGGGDGENGNGEDGGNGITTEKRSNGDEQERYAFVLSPLLRSSVVNPLAPSSLFPFPP